MPVRILLVDDNLTFVSAVRQFLDFLPGVEVVGNARNAQEALDAGSLLQPDLVLLDVAMPDMNGLDVARLMGAWPRPPHIMLLAMHDSHAYAQAAASVGAVGLACKSDFVLQLLPVIEGLVATRALAADATEAAQQIANHGAVSAE